MNVSKRFFFAALLGLSAASFAPNAYAGDNAISGARLTVWTPDQWTTKAGADRLESNNPGETVYVVATRLAGAAADAKARINAFVDGELEEVEFAANGMSGTAQDGDDDIEFSVATVADGADLLVLLVYGDPDVLKQAGPRQAVERIRASLKAR